MLFYNHKQEFIGIDDEGLKLLNYNSLEDLLEVCSDVADLFAKEPGYVHNFKNFGWIDFLQHAESDAKSAIVHGNGRIFSCTLLIHKLYLTDTPSQNGYMVEMVHVHSISGDEIKPHVAAPSKPLFEAPSRTEPEPAVIAEPSVSILPEYESVAPTQLSEPSTFDIPDFHDTDFDMLREPEPEPEYELPAPSFEIEETLPILEEEILPQPEPLQPPTPVAPIPTAPKTAAATLYSPAEQEFIDNLKTDKGYRFDPSVAANELGLPVDLIQEFIGDFIQQSYDFKSDLFEAVMKGDMNNLKILSHKLKGVAANLRIEDAFEALSVINTSGDPVEIEASLKHFYQIIEKLEGKEPSAAQGNPSAFEPKTVDKTPAPVTEPSYPAADEDDDIYEFILKQHPDEAGSPASEKFPFAASDVSDNAPIDLESVFPSDNLEPEAVVTETSNSKDAAVAAMSYDKASVAGSLGISPEFLNELIDDYKHDALIAGKQIGDAVAAFDTHQWKKTASQLKGISDHLRLNDISNELAILAETNDAQEAHKASKRLNGFLDQL